MITVEFIKKIVCKKLNFNEKELNSKSQKDNIVIVRHYFHYLALEFKLSKTSKICELSGRTHGSVYHGHKVVKRLLEYDKKIIEDISELKRLIKSEMMAEMFK